MIAYSKKFFLHTSSEEIRMFMEFKSNELRDFYNKKASTIEELLKMKVLELREQYKNEVRIIDEIKIINEILEIIISITASNNFIQLTQSTEYNNENDTYHRVDIIINTTNEKAERLGIDLKYDVFSIIKSIEEQINMYIQEKLLRLTMVRL
ncbi:hypothetical protein KST14_05365 [Fusobacterium animalis]|uniref:hypothetical protein n=1 Tax=Fusobacterium animalis TaxID=76859 RepID=UPI0032483FE8